MTEVARPNPDQLLAALQKTEAGRNRGKLRLFFGMAAGVGKTFAMLKAAQEQLKAGIDIVVGFVETHGRAETAALLQGLPTLPQKKIEYRGTYLEEMDLEAVLARKPAIVLVDELAHTNVPGSRHPKRYQDVIEILKAGIDVYSTMNIQHLESHVDTVQLITAVNVQERVPDSVLDLADQIELVDISPQELLKRFEAGKIYPKERAERATRHFFQESHLTALREIALRATAAKVDQELQGITTDEDVEIPWIAGERLMVAVSHSPHSEHLIRSTRKIATYLETPWIALHVDTGQTLSEADQNRLVKNLQQARELGAEVVTTQDTDVVAAIRRVAKSKHVVQLVIGRPEKRFWRDLFSGGSLLDRLVREDKNLDVHVIRHTEEVQRPFKLFSYFPRQAKLTDYFYTALLILGISVLNWFLNPIMGYHAVGFIFLLAVILVGLFVPLGPTLLAASLSAIIWNFFFIPPIFTFSIGAPEDIMMFFAYFAVAMVTGIFAYRIRRHQKALRQREKNTNTLYEILKAMTLARGVDAVVQVALTRIGELFDGKACVLTVEGNRLDEKPAYGNMDLDEKQRAVAQWCFENGRVAGWGTETLPMSPSMAICLKLGDRRYGVLLFRPKFDRQLTPDQKNLLFVIANQIAVAMAKTEFEEEKNQTKLLKESEILHQTLLNSISHELRTPLTTLMGAATALQEEKTASDPNARKALTQEMVDSAERLNRVFENLLDMTRLESGMLKLNMEWFDLSELVTYSLSRLQRSLSNHRVDWNPANLPIYVKGDFHLMDHALANLILNAVTYSPPASRITVQLAVQDNSAVLKVRDEGPGIPEKFRDRIFEKFYRTPGSPAGGMGLGLAIAKNLVELNGGSIQVASAPGGGAEFSIRLPLKETPRELAKTSL